MSYIPFVQQETHKLHNIEYTLNVFEMIKAKCASNMLEYFTYGFFELELDISKYEWAVCISKYLILSKSSILGKRCF